MGLSLGFGFNKSKTQNKSWIDPVDQARQVQNYEGAQSINPTYTPVSGEQIGAQMNPYIQQVIDAYMARSGEGQRAALNFAGDRATAAHAFGGTRHGVAEGVATAQFQQDQNQNVAGLLSQGYSDAADRAQQENQFGAQYPLLRQGLLNSSLAGITPTQYGKGKGFTFGGNAGWTGGK